MAQVAYDYSEYETGDKEMTVTETTLYDLVKAVSDEVETEGDYIIAEIVLGLLDKGSVRFLNHDAELAIYW